MNSFANSGSELSSPPLAPTTATLQTGTGLDYSKWKASLLEASSKLSDAMEQVQGLQLMQLNFELQKAELEKKIREAGRGSVLLN